MGRGSLRLSVFWVVLSLSAAAWAAPDSAGDIDIDRITAQAEHGDVEAQYALGAAILTGQAGPHHQAEALPWLKKAADHGQTEAQFLLGSIYLKGSGLVPIDPAKGAAFYRRAAEAGYAIAQNGYGQLLHQGIGVARNDAQAAIWFRRAADDGLGEAQSNLGVLYVNGEGVEHNPAQAYFFFKAAAEQGVSNAQYNLAWMYQNGDGVPGDMAESLRLYQQAAESGYAPAMYNLGLIYASGRSAAKDSVEAVKWLTLAAAGRDGEVRQLARSRLEPLTRDLGPDKTNDGVEAARKWLSAKP